MPVGSSGKALYKGGPEPSPLAGLRTLGQLLGLPSSSSPAAGESSGLAGAPADPFQRCSLCSANDGAFLRAGGLDLPNGAGLGYSSARRGAGSRTGAICPGAGQSVSGVGKVSRQGLTPDTTHVTNEILVNGTITCRGPRTRELRGWRRRKMKTSAKIQVSAGEPHVALPRSSGTDGRSAVRPSVCPTGHMRGRAPAAQFPSERFLPSPLFSVV